MGKGRVLYREVVEKGNSACLADKRDEDGGRILLYIRGKGLWVEYGDMPGWEGVGKWASPRVASLRDTHTLTHTHTWLGPNVG